MGFRIRPQDLLGIKKAIKTTKFFRSPVERKLALKAIRRFAAKTPKVALKGAKIAKGAIGLKALGTLGAGAATVASLALPAHELGKFIGRRSVERKPKPKLSSRLTKHIAEKEHKRRVRIAKGRRLLRARGKIK